MRASLSPSACVFADEERWMELKELAKSTPGQKIIQSSEGGRDKYLLAFVFNLGNWQNGSKSGVFFSPSFLYYKTLPSTLPLISHPSSLNRQTDPRVEYEFEGRKAFWCIALLGGWLRVLFFQSRKCRELPCLQFHPNLSNARVSCSCFLSFYVPEFRARIGNEGGGGRRKWRFVGRQTFWEKKGQN